MLRDSPCNSPWSCPFRISMATLSATSGLVTGTFCWASTQVSNYIKSYHPCTCPACTHAHCLLLGAQLQLLCLRACCCLHTNNQQCQHELVWCLMMPALLCALVCHPLAQHMCFFNRHAPHAESHRRSGFMSSGGNNRQEEVDCLQAACWWCPHTQKRYTRKSTPTSVWIAASLTWPTVPPSTKQVCNCHAKLCLLACCFLGGSAWRTNTTRALYGCMVCPVFVACPGVQRTLQACAAHKLPDPSEPSPASHAPRPLAADSICIVPAGMIAWLLTHHKTHGHWRPVCDLQQDL